MDLEKELNTELGKYGYLVKNIGFLTLGSFATKLLSFFMVPLYTSALTTGEYGTYDLLTATVSVLVPILTLNIQEAVLRFAMDRDVDRVGLVSLGARLGMGATLVVGITLGIAVHFGVVLFEPELIVFFCLFFILQVFSGLITSYATGSGLIKELSIAGVVSSAITIVLNVVFLVPLHMGLYGYFLANIIGPLFQAVFLGYKTRFFVNLRLTSPSRELRKEAIDYSAPLIANSIAWWINSLADRYIVTFFCGLAANGVYSVATKIPSILNVFQTIFNRAWSLSSTKSFDPEDKDGFYANTYRAYNCLMVILCSVVILFDKLLARFLYSNDFYAAWQYVPWLTLAILFGALIGFLEGIFIAVKDSKTPAKCTVAGAFTNILLNFILTPTLGALGAAIATAVCYLEIWIARLVLSRRYLRFHINLVRDVTSYVLLVIQSLCVLLLADELIMYGAVGFLLAVVIVLYAGDIVAIGGKVLGVKGRGKK